MQKFPQLTIENPAWGIELTRILLDVMEDTNAKHGLKSVLRITPNDTRGVEPPPRMQKAVEAIPASEAEFIGEMMCAVDTTRFVAADYGM